MSDNFWDEVIGKPNPKKEEEKKSQLTSEPPAQATQTEPKTETLPVSDPFLSDQTTTENPQTEQKQTQPIFDPFSQPTVEKTGENVVTQASSETSPFSSDSATETTQPPAPSPPSNPFEDKQALSQEEEFAKQKPATSGKNLSFMIYGKKGTSKTATTLSLPGKIFAISLDQQTAIIHEDFFNKDPRIEVWDGIEFFNSKDPQTKLETATKTVDYIHWLLENPCKKFQPDWILFDGTERLSHVCEMAMRSQENLLPYEGVKNRNAWKYRNDLINNFVQRATQIARLGVIYTAFTDVETVTTAMGEEKREGPKWAGDIEQKTQIVIKTTSVPIQNGRAFVAEVESSKVSYIPTGRKVIIGERLNSGEIQNNIGIKAIFTPEGIKKYFGSGGD